MNLVLGMKYPITYDYLDKKWPQRPGGYRIPRYGVAHDTGNPGSTAYRWTALSGPLRSNN